MVFHLILSFLLHFTKTEYDLVPDYPKNLGKRKRTYDAQEEADDQYYLRKRRRTEPTVPAIAEPVYAIALRDNPPPPKPARTRRSATGGVQFASSRPYRESFSFGPSGPPKPPRTPRSRSYTRRRAPARRPYTRRARVTRAVYRQKRFAFQRSYRLAPALGVLGSLAGTYLGGPSTAALGATVGNALGHGFKTLTGFGDYHVRENTLSPGSPPAMANGALPGGACIISHREYLGDIISNSVANTFHSQNFSINPGLANTFPWLSQLATNFTQFRIMGMAFEFRSMSADALNSTNTALGQVIIATNYDPASPAFSSKAEMENSAYAQSIKPSSSVLHLIECDTSTMPVSEMYVRSGDIPTGTDIRFYDLGTTTVATNGFQGTSVNAGELWVTYQVLLLKPKIVDGLGEDVSYWAGYFAGGITNALPLGTNDPVLPSDPNTNSLAVDFPTSGIIDIGVQPYKKCFQFDFAWSGSLTSSLSAPSYALVGLSTTEAVYNPTAADWTTEFQTPSVSASQSSTRLMWTIILQCDGSSSACRLILSSGTLPSAATACALRISELPSDAAFPYS
ncbi:capsid protein [Crucivirus-324]|nr:capsid protein [Crucivirus-324]